MISERDIYADKNGKITDDPSEFAFQVAVAGCFLDERVARRYGIGDVLVSSVEPNATRRITGRSAASVKITKAAEAATEPTPEKPQEPAEAAEPKVESEPEAVATGQDKPKPTAKKEK